MSRKTGNDGHVTELFIESARYILGEIRNFPKLAGDRAQVEATRRAIETSRALYEALNDDRTTASRAVRLAEEKKVAAENFRKVTGVEWKL